MNYRIIFIGLATVGLVVAGLATFAFSSTNDQREIRALANMLHVMREVISTDVSNTQRTLDVRTSWDFPYAAVSIADQICNENTTAELEDPWTVRVFIVTDKDTPSGKCLIGPKISLTEMYARARAREQRTNEQLAREIQKLLNQ